MSRHLTASLLAVLLVYALPRSSAAQDSWPQAVVRGGGLLADVASDVRVDASLGSLGSSIDLENDLGFATHATTWFVDGVWRISRKSQLQVDYEGTKRQVSQVVLSKTITVDDRTFTVGAQVDAFFDTFYLSTNYGYAFVANPTVEFGASIGLTLIRLRTGFGLSAQGSGGGNEVSRDLSDNSRFSVPVPLPGVFVNVRPHPRVTIHGSTRVIKGTISDITASLVEAKAEVDVTIARPLGVGASYYYNRADVERNGTVIDARLKYSFSGPQIYAVLSF